ncbi:hypothetical protein GDO86_018720 [Hymenochirus boettgeri]|uniref:Major vault protein n=1 Tax=Hymenochirus boettgeri TaxID=247094 RepID=A0A8T2IEN4_9PIPI|nr:hypothetical protein GDO86_018720 [Hymenochirus boettgeri]
MSEESIIRIPPYFYIHVLDQNSNISRVETGPKTYIRQDNERVLYHPKRMVMVPPRHYCVIQNPVQRDTQNQVLFDDVGQAKLFHGDKEIRLSQDPFPLYPGEELLQDIIPLTVVLANTALHLKALLDLEDDSGKFVAGDEWLFEGPGTYIPRKEVEVIETIQASVIRHNQAIRLRARKECKDREGRDRVTGEEWLVKKVGAYLPGVFEEVVDIVDAFVLTDKRALHIRATKTFRDDKGNLRRTRRRVRAVVGETYMLTQDEELWEKELPANVEALLSSGKDPLADRSDRHGQEQEGTPRDKTCAVTYRVPHNAAVQVYDYREKKARVVFGPELVILGPDEQFTVLSLSGSTPKRSNVIKAVCLLLGPDFCTDIINIETADHARLQIKLSYNWHFDIKDKSDPAEASKIFTVPDFVGDACKAIASRIRGAVASVQFDDFHKNSNRIICSAVFGFDESMKIRNSFKFPQNNLVITSVDIQTVEPVDQRTRDALQKSVQLAIEITTNSQEATARHEAERLEQEAKGRLERQRITDQAEAERARKELLELEALSTVVESTGAAKAEAQSKAEAARIEGEGAVLQAKLRAEALAIETEAELERLRQARSEELRYTEEKNKLEVERSQKLTEIEIKKFREMTEAIGTSTLRDIALAGPELQVKLLKGLGIQSTLITDGSSPINLFSTANGLLGLAAKPHQESE